MKEIIIIILLSCCLAVLLLIAWRMVKSNTASFANGQALATMINAMAANVDKTLEYCIAIRTENEKGWKEVRRIGKVAAPRKKAAKKRGGQLIDNQLH